MWNDSIHKHRGNQRDLLGLEKNLKCYVSHFQDYYDFYLPGLEFEYI